MDGKSSAGGGNLTEVIYGSPTDSINYFYDEFDRPIQIVYNDSGKVVNNYYSADGTLAKATYGIGAASDMTYLFEYDSSGRIVRSTQFDNTQLYQRTEHLYDEFNTGPFCVMINSSVFFGNDEYFCVLR